MSESYVLDIDISTTSSRALLIDDHGNVTAFASSLHTLRTRDRFGLSRIRASGAGVGAGAWSGVTQHEKLALRSLGAHSLDSRTWIPIAAYV